MGIRRVDADKKAYLPLLLLGDEQEDMIDRYLERGVLYVLEEEGETKALCVVTEEGGGVLEIKNMATEPRYQRRGYGKQLIEFLVSADRGTHRLLRVGTGDSPATIPFYEACGFRRAFVVKNFFVEHYRQPIFEQGVQLVDMVYLERPQRDFFGIFLLAAPS